VNRVFAQCRKDAALSQRDTLDRLSANMVTTASPWQTSAGRSTATALVGLGTGAIVDCEAMAGFDRMRAQPPNEDNFISKTQYN
jgi:hypothetical protein